MFAMLHVLTLLTVFSDACVAQMPLNQCCMSTSSRCTTWQACGCETCVRGLTLTASYVARCGRASSTAWFTTWTLCRTVTSTNWSCAPSMSSQRYVARSCTHQCCTHLHSVKVRSGSNWTLSVPNYSHLPYYQHLQHSPGVVVSVLK